MRMSQSGKHRRPPVRLRGHRAPCAVLPVVAACLLIFAAIARAEPAVAPIVRAVRFEGNRRVDDDALRGVVRTESASFLRARRLDRRQLEKDGEEIVRYYRDHGFLDVLVPDTRVDEDAEGGVTVTFVIEEGPQTVLSEIRVFGNLFLDTRAIAAVLAVETGRRLNASLIPQDEFRIYTLYADYGFFSTEVTHTLTETDGGTLLTYLIDEGSRTYLGGVDVVGNDRTRRLVVARELTLRRGDVFSRREVLLSQQRIFETGLFVDVEMDPQVREAEADTVDLVVRVREQKEKWVGTGVGYGTRDLFRLSSEWGHRNLRGTGRQVSLEGVLGTGFFPSELNKLKMQVRYLEPWLLATRTTGIVNLYRQRTYEEYAGTTFWLERTGGTLSARRKVGEGIRTWLSYGYESINVPSDLGDRRRIEVLRDLGLERDGETSIVEFVFERDTRDHFFEPSQGSMFRFSLGLAGGPLGGRNEFAKLTGFWNYYIQFSPRSVLSFKVSAGMVNRFWGDSEIPAYERFRTGGPTTVRGYREDEIQVPGSSAAPGDSTSIGTPSGPGSALLVTKLELTFPLAWKLGGTVFLDGGNVWSDFGGVEVRHFLSVSEDPSYYRYSTGVGLWFPTPVGPLQVGYGVKLRPGLRLGDVFSSAVGWVIFGQSL